MSCRESAQSPRPKSDGTIERLFIVEGTTDDVQAEAEAFAKASPTYRGLFRSALPDTTPIGRGIWEVSFTYSPPDVEDNGDPGADEPKGDEPTLGTLEMDGSGGTIHITQCLSQKSYPGGGAGSFKEIEERKIVGLHKDGVNGVDIDAPGAIFTVTKKWLPAAVTGEYLLGLSRLRAHTNKAPYLLKWGYKGNKYEIEFPENELRYISTRATTSFTRRGVGVWEISYTMMHAENRTQIILADGSAGIIIPKKNGHDYLWTIYKKENLTGGYKATIETPECAFVSQVYESADFKERLKF